MEEYIRSGRDKSIVYSDPNGLYTKRKQQRRSTPSASSIEPSQGARLCISQFHLRPAPPPPRATAGHLHALSVPGMGHLQILHCPGAGHSPTPGHSRGFDTHAVSYQNMTTHKVLLKKKNKSSIKDRNKLKRVVKACSRFYACVFSLLIKPELHSEIGAIKFLFILFEENPFTFIKLFITYNLNSALLILMSIILYQN